jgi:hypothetical protein
MSMSLSDSRTTIAVRTGTKTKMDKWRAPGQCYDRFLCQLIELWEKTHYGNGDGKTNDSKSRFLTGISSDIAFKKRALKGIANIKTAQ